MEEPYSGVVSDDAERERVAALHEDRIPAHRVGLRRVQRRVERRVR